MGIGFYNNLSLNIVDFILMMRIISSDILLSRIDTRILRIKSQFLRQHITNLKPKLILAGKFGTVSFLMDRIFKSARLHFVITFMVTSVSWDLKLSTETD
jgi:hypothetical protein